jgi:hypothetical protein
MTERYPLSWPPGRPRRTASARKPGRFNTKKTVSSQYGSGSYRRSADITINEAVNRLQGELDRIGARLPVISSNLELRLDGLPRSGQRKPEDPGVAVYFQLAGKPVCLPCDTYSSVEANIAAVAAHIEASRAVERHGVASIAEQFSGFTALPTSKGAEWWEVLQIARASATRDAIQEAYRKLARQRHPDHGGSDHQMAELNSARDAALREVCI